MKKIFYLSFIIFIYSLELNSQSISKTGTTSAKFLNIPIGARAIGMGGAFVSTADDATAMYWNPAGISNLKKMEGVISHTSWLADISFNYIGLVTILNENSSLGFQITSMTMGEFERTTEEEPDGTGDYFNANSYAFGLTYASKLTEWFSIGGNVKYIHEGIWNSSANGFAIDIGTLFVTPFDGIKFGAGVTNFGEKLKISGDDLLTQKDLSPNNGNNPNINATLSTDRFELPLNLQIGLSYEPINNENEKLLFEIDASHPNDNLEYINAGTEFSFYNRMLSLRAGIRGAGQKESESQYSFGGGIFYNNFKFDYAFLRFGRLKNIQTIGLSYLF